MKYPYVFAWGNNSRRADLKGHACRVVAKGRMGTVLIEFESGERVASSYRSLRPNPSHLAADSHGRGCR